MKKKIIAVAAVAVAMAMCGVLFSSCKQNEDADSGAAPATTPLAQGNLEDTITTMCTVSAASVSDVATSVNAPIAEVLAHVGDVVTKGQVLARLDQTSLQSDLELKQKALALAQERYNTSVQSAQNTLDRYKADYDNTVYGQQNAALEALNARKAALATQDANNAVATTDQNVKKAQEEMTTWESRYNAILAGKTLYTIGDNWFETDEPTEAVAAGGAIQTIEYVSAKVTDARNVFNATKEAAFNAAYATCLARVGETHYDEIHPLEEAYNNAARIAATTAITSSRQITDAQTALNTTIKDTSAVDTAKRDVEEAQKQLDLCEITAPISGTVVTSKAAINATPSAADALYSISDDSNFQVTGLLNEYDSTRVSIGMRAEITTDATGDTPMIGEVQLISPQATDTNGNFTVTVAVTQPSSELRGGMTGRLRIVLASADNCFYVPGDSIGTDENGNSVIYVLPDDSSSSDASSTAQDASAATPITVTTGVTTDYYTQVTADGLTAGMPVLNTPPV